MQRIMQRLMPNALLLRKLPQELLDMQQQQFMSKLMD